MSKLFDRVVRLENRLDDYNRIQYIEQNILRLEQKVDVLAEHLNIRFREGVTAVKKEMNCNE